jgi:hypothetical protein
MGFKEAFEGTLVMPTACVEVTLVVVVDLAGSLERIGAPMGRFSRLAWRCLRDYEVGG